MGVQDCRDSPFGERQFDFQNCAFQIEIAVDRVSWSARQLVTARFAETVREKSTSFVPAAPELSGVARTSISNNTSPRDFASLPEERSARGLTH